jgi:hypothetical protein
MQAKCVSFLCLLITIYNQFCAYVLHDICCNLLEKNITVYNNVDTIMNSYIKLCINTESIYNSETNVGVC